MATLVYVGKAQAAANDLVNEAYLTALLATNMQQPAVDALLTSGFAPYVTKAYVDTQDALNATKAFIDAGDATRLHLSQVGVNNGICPLDGTGRVAAARVSAASTQRWPRPFVTPAAYNSTTITATGTEVQLYTAAVADPGFTYKLLVTGLVDTSSSIDGEFPVVRVRQGATNGQLVATGGGLSEGYGGGTQTAYTTAGTYTFTLGANRTVDVVVIGGGGEGLGGGNGGGAGSWAGITLTKDGGSPNLNSSATTLSIVVGAGGNSAPGAASTMTYLGTSEGNQTLTGAGGGHGTAPDAHGQSPGNFTFNGRLYVGGTAVTGPNVDGHPPGGGGSGGVSPTGGGARGAAYVTTGSGGIGNLGSATVVPSALNAQTAITGATTLYVMMVRSGSASTSSATALQPHLFIVPIPA